MKILTQYGFKVSIEVIRDTESDTATVTVTAPMYTRTIWTMEHCYKSSQFSDNAILKDSAFITTMINHYPVN